MNYFKKFFAHFNPAEKIYREEINAAFEALEYVKSELREAKEELKNTQEKIKESKKIAVNLEKKVKAANLSIKSAATRNKEIDDKIKADRIEEQKLWNELASSHEKSLKFLREEVAREEIKARSEIKAIHQAIKDAAISRP